MPKIATLTSWLIVLPVGSCLQSGDFCDIYDSQILFPGPVAVIVATEAESAAQTIDARNTYWQEVCP